ncbi:MAG: hypothetical protein V4607_01895 [Pseudomonadota bacterium]
MSSPNVIAFQGKTIIYEQFNDGWSAIVFGTGEPVGVGPELLEAIAADQQHQREKRERA